MSTSTLHAAQHPAQTGALGRVGSVLLHEFRKVIPPTVYFFVGFNLIVVTKRLFLQEYLIQYTGFLIATTGALIVGKVVLVANAMSLLRRFDRAPLIYPILFKTLVYTLLVGAARLIEAVVHYLIAGGVLGGGRFIEHYLGEWSWPRFLATQLWVVVLFLIWVTATELNALFGDGELVRIFFRWRSTELKATRRERIRMLVRLSRLMESYPFPVLEDPHSAPHRELVRILRGLAERGRADTPA